MAGPGDHDQLLGFSGELVSLLAELAGVSLIAGDEQHGARGDRLDVFERVEVHESDVAAQHRLGAGVRAVAPGGAVEVVELAVDRR